MGGQIRYSSMSFIDNKKNFDYSKFVNLSEYEFKLLFHLNEQNTIEIDTREFVRVCFAALNERKQENKNGSSSNQKKKKKKKKKREQKLSNIQYSEEGEMLFQKIIESNLGIAKKLEAEDDEGDTEYKLKLIDNTIERVNHLTTQMKFRLEEGKGEAHYMLGYHDEGEPFGLNYQDMTRTLEILGYLAKENESNVEIKRAKIGYQGLVMECSIKKKTKPSNKLSFRVLMFGSSGSGKSTLISVLLSNELDNGKGFARMRIFKHKHELMSGHTSSIVSVELPKFLKNSESISGNARILQLSQLNQNETKDDKESPLITLIDTGGQTKYESTFLQGFMTMEPNYYFLFQSLSNQSLEFENKLEISIGLAQNFGIILTHSDKSTLENNTQLIRQIKIICAKYEDISALVVKNIKDAKFIGRNAGESIIPIFFVSSVSGEGIPILKEFLNELSGSISNEKILKRRQKLHTEFNILKVIREGKSKDNVISGKINKDYRYLVKSQKEIFTSWVLIKRQILMKFWLMR